MENSSPHELPEEIESTLLRAFETISEQQRTISEQLAKLLAALNKPADTSLIDELSKLLKPLFADVATIKAQLGTPEAEE